jgi:PBSX family phage terminase large subunit
VGPDLLELYDDLLSHEFDYKIAIDPRGTGKSLNFLLASLIIARSMTTKILCCREHMVSIDESSKAELELLIEEKGWHDEFYVTRKNIIHKRTKSSYLFRGLAKNATNLKSIPKIDIAIVEECENVSQDSLVRILMPTLRQNMAELWMMGNRRFRTDAPYDVFMTGNPPPRTRIFDHTYLENPHISAKFLADAEHMKKTKPALYRHIYLGDMLNEAGIRMVNHLSLQTERPEFTKDDMVVIGVDIARSGDDACTIYVRRSRWIIHKEKHYEMDSDKLGPILQGLTLKHKPMFVNIDATGHGAWVGDCLKPYNVQVRPIVFSKSADQDDRYSNKRTELYSYVDEYTLNGGTIPDDKALIDDLEASFYLPDSRDRARLIPKDKIQTQLGRSPDDGDGFVLTLETHGKPMFTLKNYELAKKDNDKLINKVISMGSFS